MMIDHDILMLAALVAAYVGVAKAFGLPVKYSPVLALLVSAVFVLVPEQVKQTIITISIIGLTASGAYQYTKNRGDPS
jgi:predicted metal-binding membrane protein